MRSLLIIFCLSILGVANSQIEIGGQYVNMFGDKIGLSNGFGTVFNYENSNKITFIGAFNYHFPIEGEALVLGKEGNSSSVQVPIYYKISIAEFSGGIKYNFVNSDEHGFYGIMELGYMYKIFKYEYYDFNYSLEEENLKGGSTLNFNIGLGYKKDFNFGALFVDLRGITPLNKTKNENINFSILPSLTIGLLIPFE